MMMIIITIVFIIIISIIISPASRIRSCGRALAGPSIPYQPQRPYHRHAQSRGAASSAPASRTRICGRAPAPGSGQPYQKLAAERPSVRARASVPYLVAEPQQGSSRGGGGRVHGTPDLTRGWERSQQNAVHFRNTEKKKRDQG